MAALTHAGRTHVSPARAGFALLTRHPSRTESGMQELRFFGDYFSPHPSIADDDYQQLHDLSHC